MAKRKVGDRIEVKSKYFTPFNEMTGTITAIDEYYHEFTVKMDNEWSVEGEKVFHKEELRGIKP